MDGNRNNRDQDRNWRSEWNDDENRSRGSYEGSYGSDRDRSSYGDYGRSAGGYGSRSDFRDTGERNHGQARGSYGSGQSDYGSRGSLGSDRNFGGGYDEYSRRGSSSSYANHNNDYDRDRDFGARSGGSFRDYGSQSLGSGSSSRGWESDRDFGRGSFGGGDWGSRSTNRDDSSSRNYGGSRWSGSGSSYGGGERGYGEAGRRGFWDKASDEVSSWFGDRDAEQRREQDQHRGRGPKNYARSDERIKEDINDRLTDDGWLDASSVEVAVKDREVTLSGTVNDRNAKRRAEDIAEDVSGVSHVQNNLRVKSQYGTSDVNVDRSTSSDASTGLGSTTGMTVAKSAAGGQR